MQRYSEWCSDHHQDYWWQALGRSHRALGGYLTALDLLKMMGDRNDQFAYPERLIEKGHSVGVDLSQKPQ